MFIVSYYDQSGRVRNKAQAAWSTAVDLASRKAVDPKACPVLICSEDGHLLWQVNK